MRKKRMDENCKFCEMVDVCNLRKGIGTESLCDQSGIPFCLGFKKKWYLFWKSEKDLCQSCK